MKHLKRIETLEKQVVGLSEVKILKRSISQTCKEIDNV